MIRCSQCGEVFDQQAGPQRVASISGSIMGDEQIDSYYLCSRCGVYTVEIYFDRFLGEDEVSVEGPVSKEAGDEKVKLIRECPTPWDKKCRCKSHQSYFEGWLD
jgi:rubredoxin